jgi:hypothetical protein
MTESMQSAVDPETKDRVNYSPCPVRGRPYRHAESGKGLP